jgi:V8-like Glu-specific endopeptidase
VHDSRDDCVGVLYFKSSPFIIGTGFLIAADLVLTVKHNVYSQQDKKESKEMVFYPGVSHAFEKEELGIIGYRGASCSCNTAMQSSLWKAYSHEVEGIAIILELLNILISFVAA